MKKEKTNRVEKLKSKFSGKFLEIAYDKFNSKNYRMQKKSYIQKFDDEIFTITIERGDNLNKKE